MTTRPTKERPAVADTTETVHFETIETLCRGADYQDHLAVQARETIAAIAPEVDRLRQRLAELQPRLAEAQQTLLSAERLAPELRHIAAFYCAENGWEMPAPKTADPGDTAPDGAEANQIRAALDGEPEAAKETDDAEQ